MIKFNSDKIGPAYPLPGCPCQWAPLGNAPPRRKPRAWPSAEALLEESLVTSHHQLRLELLHRFERDTDHDQDRGAAELEVLVRGGEKDPRQRGHSGEEQRAWERQSREDAVEEFSGRAPGPHAGDEPAVLLQ